ncbi:hypothetical protein LT335_00241 [Spiroplasma sp. JKS002669]|uniref:hypothetical protein n=1 Tax=Spiroplasma attinicola TaxID=2904537 RepID=UPI0020C0C9A9|nr:hypothetical protein [Spiroplasma sp. JKS002669]MCL6428694.1 hypothetical protein [Spiroplasma sp. JKS002669]
MRKLLVNLTGILTFSSSALPLVGCTFNSYANQVINKVAANLASETSNVIKSLIAAKNLDADTQATISAALQPTIKNKSIIKNQTEITEINNWNQFQANWGLNNNIKTKGFTKDSFIVASGQGSLTKQINSINSTNQTLSYFDYISALNVIDNSTLYGLLFGQNAIAQPIVKNFLTSLKTGTLAEPWSSLLNNLINDYQGNVLEPITQLLNELVDGWSEVTTPDELVNFFQNWKDDQGIPYSEWVNSNAAWKLTGFTNWKSNDINLYRGGVIINHLFKEMGLENSEKITNPQYIGAIISDNLNNPTNQLLAAFQPYLDLLLTNPKYLLQLITGLVPLIKDLIFNAPDLTQGIEHLTLGNTHPTNKNNNSYNLKTVFTDLKTIINDKTKVEALATKLLSSPFLYDIKISLSLPPSGSFDVPLPAGLDVKSDTKNELITTITNLLTGSDFGNTFNDIFNVIEKLNDQFQGSDGIDLNLKNIKNLLTNKDNGLLTLLSDVADTIANIISPNNPEDEITNEQLAALYESIGGQTPKNNTTELTFRKNSILWKLQTELANNQSDLSNIVKVIYRNDQYKGVTNIIMDQNENWIKENYTNYLSSNYAKSNISNINYQTTKNDSQTITNISYDFVYEIGTNKYHFFIKGAAIDNNDDFSGTHNFKFTDIYKI